MLCSYECGIEGLDQSMTRRYYSRRTTIEQTPNPWASLVIS